MSATFALKFYGIDDALDMSWAFSHVQRWIMQDDPRIGKEIVCASTDYRRKILLRRTKTGVSAWLEKEER